jgi:hypothetical protein
VLEAALIEANNRADTALALVDRSAPAPTRAIGPAVWSVISPRRSRPQIRHVLRPGRPVFGPGRSGRERARKTRGPSRLRAAWRGAVTALALFGALEMLPARRGALDPSRASAYLPRLRRAEVAAVRQVHEIDQRLGPLLAPGEPPQPGDDRRDQFIGRGEVDGVFALDPATKVAGLAACFGGDAYAFQTVR